MLSICYCPGSYLGSNKYSAFQTPNLLPSLRCRMKSRIRRAGRTGTSGSPTARGSPSSSSRRRATRCGYSALSAPSSSSTGIGLPVSLRVVGLLTRGPERKNFRCFFFVASKTEAVNLGMESENKVKALLYGCNE